MKKYLTAIRKLNLKTIIFNFSYFKFADAIKFPVLVSGNVYLRDLKGTVTINAPVKFGMIEIGFGSVGIFDDKKGRTIWHVLGKVIFERNASIGHGSKISIDTNGELTIGENFMITANSTIFVTDKISFGKNCLISWDVLIMDSDVHKIMKDGNHVNPDKPVVVGDDVWIGCRCSILKGSSIPAGSVIAANTLLHSVLEDNNCIYGGTPVKKLAENINWVK